jgi:predicted SAM-dependent methyltransferase
LAIKSTVSASLKKTLPVGLFSGIRLLGNQIIVYRLHRKGVRKARAYARKSGLKLNIGCGPNRKQGWINIDLSLEAELSLDMRERIPFDNSSATIIYSEHFLEHLDYPNDAKHFLRECFRVLEPNGLFRVGVPDTAAPLLDYAGVGNGWWLQACKIEFWHPEWCKTSMDYINYHFRQDTEHRYAYDFETMESVLKETGFVEIEKCEFDPALDTKSRNMARSMLRHANRQLDRRLIESGECRLKGKTPGKGNYNGYAMETAKNWEPYPP